MMQAGTARAVAALQRAALQGPDAMAQVPLEAILNNSLDGLQVRLLACGIECASRTHLLAWSVLRGHLDIAMPFGKLSDSGCLLPFTLTCFRSDRCCPV